MAKKPTKYEVLSTIKGLDPKDPQGYIHAGTRDQPTLVDLEDNSDTRDLVTAGALRIWPGPAAEPVKESDLVKDLKEKLEGAEKTFAAQAKEIKELQKKLEASETEVEGLQADVKRLQDELGAAKKDAQQPSLT